MFKLEKFAEIVLPKDPNDDTKKLTEAITNLSEHVDDLQKKIDEIKPTETDPDPVNPVEPDPDPADPKE